MEMSMCLIGGMTGYRNLPLTEGFYENLAGLVKLMVNSTAPQGCVLIKMVIYMWLTVLMTGCKFLIQTPNT
jgi:hypothetical protein